MSRTLSWKDWAAVALGAWLAASPWLLGYLDDPIAVMNALFVGTLLVAQSLLEFRVNEEIEEWIDMMAGAWLIASPYVLGFATVKAAVVNAVSVGMTVIVLGIVAMWSFDEGPDRGTPSA